MEGPHPSLHQQGGRLVTKKKAGDKKPTVEEHIEESAEVAALRREIRRLQRQIRHSAGATAMVVGAVQDALADIEPIPMPPRPRPSRKSRREVAVLHLSDWQIGSLTENFDSSIARDRIHDQLLPKIHQIVEARRESAAVNEIVILVGGDMVDGSSMRANQPWEVDSTALEQALYACPGLIAETCSSMAALFPKVRVFSVRGNHGRIGPTKGNADPKSVNWDTVASEVARTQLGKLVDGERMSWTTEVEGFFQVIDIGSTGLLLIHGDQFRGSGGFAGIPVYSIVKKMARWADSLPHSWSVMMMGHYHNPTSLTIGSRLCYINGALKSGGEWELEELAMSTRPAQRLQFWDEDRGPIVDQVLWLE
jgi:hypothetical protein